MLDFPRAEGCTACPNPSVCTQAQFLSLTKISSKLGLAGLHQWVTVEPAAPGQPRGAVGSTAIYKDERSAGPRCCSHSLRANLPGASALWGAKCSTRRRGRAGDNERFDTKKAQQWAVASGGLSSRTISESHCQATVRTRRVNTRQLSHLVACS